MVDAADRTIEEIEAELFRAKFAESPAEEYLSDRAKKRLAEADIAKAKDERVKAAFAAGYRLARTERSGGWQNFFLGVWLATIAWGFLVIVIAGG